MKFLDHVDDSCGVAYIAWLDSLSDEEKEELAELEKSLYDLLSNEGGDEEEEARTSSRLKEVKTRLNEMRRKK